MSLKETLTIPRGSKSVNKYFQMLRSVVDDLALVKAPITENALVIYALNGIDPEFKEIAN